MKKIILVSIYSIFCFASFAQLTSLHEDFSTTCVSNGPVPPGPGIHWITYCLYGTALNWQCSITNGRNSSPGVECTNYINNISNLDTAYLITPKIDVHTHSGNVYLLFDTKTSHVIGSTAKLTLYAKNDTTTSQIADTSAATLHSYSSLQVSPGFSNSDTSGWVTHQVDLTSFKTQPFFIAFRYTADVGFGSIWYIDNINITDTPLYIPVINKEIIPLTVIGNSTPDQIKVSFSAENPGVYQLSLNDMMGRTVYSTQINTQSITTNYTIGKLNLHPGMYFIKIGNGTAYGTAKTVVQ